MRQGLFTVTGNRMVASGNFEMRLSGDASAITAPGEFVEVALDGFFLRRPFAAADFSDDGLTLLYRVVGRGTEAMSRMGCGERLDVITGLGNGFNLRPKAATAADRLTGMAGDAAGVDASRGSTFRPLLVAGGMGVAPIYALAKRIALGGVAPVCALGFNTAAEVTYAEELRSLGARVEVATMDGSAGIKGFVTDAIREKALEFNYFYACGPLPMMRALCLSTDVGGQVSMEARMGCGYGFCMGCTIMTAGGPKRVCKEGPVFGKEEILW